MPRLLLLKPGTRFRLREMPEVTGVLVRASESRAVVRLDRPMEDVEFTEPDGRTRHFQSRGTRTTSWTPAAVVDVVSFEPLEIEEPSMSKKTAKTKKTHEKPSPKKPAEGRVMSCLEAAAKVLGEKKQPMTTAAMIEAMAAKGYWTSPGGKTPAATLYSAILRELGKGKESRFKKVDRGQFALA